jgi:ERCC4-type nuclease
MPENKPVHVIIDNREQKLIKLLEKNKENITFETKQLDVADIVISEKIAIERKEGKDLISSIIDNRLFEQLSRLKETYLKPILILEGFNDEVLENTGMKLSSIYGALSKIACSMEIPIIPTRNINDTLIAIERIAYREQFKMGESIMSRKAPKAMSEEERKAFIIEGLIDSGPKKAKELIYYFKSPYNVLKAIKKTEIIYTKTGNPKGIKGPLEDLRGYGWKFVLKNQEILFGIKEKIKERNPQKTLDDL